MEVDSGKNCRIPTKWFNSVLDSMAAVENPQQLFDIVIAIKQQFGISGIAYGLVTPNNFRGEIYHIHSDESEQWKQTYIQKEYWKMDTRIITARKQIAAFRWSDLPHRADFISRDIMRDVWDGITVPVHGPKNLFGFLHYAYPAEQKKIGSWLQYIQPYMVYLAQQVIEVESALVEKGLISPCLCHCSGNSVELSLQQRKCLVWAAEGKTTQEIAMILGITASTVNKHLNVASELLNANNRTHAIAKAIDGKFIALEYKKKPKIFYF